MLLSLFFLFLGVTFLGFGGAQAITPFLYQQLVEFSQWITAEEFLELVGLSQLTPGPILVNSATYAGFKVAGLAGASVATLGVSLPSIIILSVAMFIKQRFESAFFIIRESFQPLALALLLLGIIVLVQNLLFIKTGSFSGQSLALIGWGFFLVRFWQISPFYVCSSLGIGSVLIDYFL